MESVAFSDKSIKRAGLKLNTRMLQKQPLKCTAADANNSRQITGRDRAFDVVIDYVNGHADLEAMPVFRNSGGLLFSK